MFRALLKTRLQALFSSLFRTGRTKKKHGAGFAALIALFAVYIVGCFFWMFGMMFHAICLPLASAGLGWLYFALAAVMSLLLAVVMSAFMAQQQLFSARDNELLLSMPIPPAMVLASRMLALLVMNFAVVALVAGPAGVVWAMNCGVSAAGVVLFIAVFLLLLFLILALDCVFGWLLALITQRVRNKSMVSTVFSLAFLALYFYGYSRANTYMAALISQGAAIGETVRRAVYPAYAAGMAIAEHDPVSLLLFAACCLLPFALVYAVLSATFVRLVTAQRGAAKIKYRERALRAGSASSALLKRELRHFAANGMYILNAALGSAITLAGAVTLILYRDLPARLTAAEPGLTPYLGAAGVAVLSLLAATDIISAPSVSLEGKTLWIAQSLPVPGGQVLEAKARMHLVVALPPNLLCAAALIGVLRLPLLTALAAFLAPAAVTAFCAYLGVVVNLHFPKLDFVNEVYVVKQSMSVMIAMFAGMGAVALPAGLYAWQLTGVMGSDAFIFLCTALYAAGAFVMRRYLYRGGARRFAAL